MKLKKVEIQNQSFSAIPSEAVGALEKRRKDQNQWNCAGGSLGKSSTAFRFGFSFLIRYRNEQMKNKLSMESNTDHTAAVWQLLTSYILAFVKRFSLKSESNGFPSEQLVCLQIIGPKSHCSGWKQEQLCAPMHCFQTPLPCGQPVGRGAVFVGDMILVEVELVIPSVLSLCMSPESN